VKRAGKENVYIIRKMTHHVIAVDSLYNHGRDRVSSQRTL